MELKPPPRPRSTLNQVPDGIEIVIPPRRGILWILIFVFWMLMWAYLAPTVPGLLLLSLPLELSIDWAMTIVLVLVVVLMGVAGLQGLLWELFGRERIRIGGASLILSRDILGSGRQSYYDIQQVRNLRVFAMRYVKPGWRLSLPSWVATGGVVAFDYGASTVRFGYAIEEAEADLLVRDILHRFPVLGPASAA